MILNFNQFIKENIDNNISIKIDNANQEFTSQLIDKFSFIVTKRLVKNLRPIKITGSLDSKDIELNIIMNNKDVVNGTYKLENIEISINNEIVYDVDRKDFNSEMFTDKLSQEYVKYLKSKKFKVKT